MTKEEVLKGVRKFKILAANKQVNKVFYDIDDAKAHIIKNKLFAAYDSVRKGKIIIEETFTKMHVVDCAEPNLSSESKQLILDKILTTNYTVDSSFSTGRIIRQHYEEKKVCAISNIAIDVVKSVIGVTDSDLANAFKNYATSRTENATLSMMFKHQNYIVINKEFIKRVLPTIKPERVVFLYVSTDYAPCNNISVCIRAEDSEEDIFVLQVREKDIVASHGYCYGRNVSVRGMAMLDDDMFKKFKSKTTML